MTALDERPATVDGGDTVDAPDLTTPQMNLALDPAPVLWRPCLTDSGFWLEPWCPPHCAGHPDPSTLHTHTSEFEHFGEFGVIVTSETGRPAQVAVCDLPMPQVNLTDAQADAFAAQLKRAARVVRRINDAKRPTDQEIVAEILGNLRSGMDDDALFAAYDDLGLVVERERLDALDDTASQIYLAEKRAAEQAADGDGFVHGCRVGAPLGDQAQCGAPDGRATKIACAVTCPACKAWMSDAAWSSHTGSAVAA